MSWKIDRTRTSRTLSSIASSSKRLERREFESKAGIEGLIDGIWPPFSAAVSKRWPSLNSNFESLYKTSLKACVSSAEETGIILQMKEEKLNDGLKGAAKVLDRGCSVMDWEGGSVWGLWKRRRRQKSRRRYTVQGGARVRAAAVPASCQRQCRAVPNDAVKWCDK